MQNTPFAPDKAALIIRLFRNRQLAQLFSIGVLAAFIVGLLLASLLFGSLSLVRIVVNGAIIGLVGSVALFVVLNPHLPSDLDISSGDGMILL